MKNYKQRDCGPYNFEGQTYLTKAAFLKAQSQARQLKKWLDRNPKLKYTKLQKWFLAFIEEKNIDLSKPVTAGDGSTLYLGDVCTAILNAPTEELAGIEKMLVMLDFKNANIENYFKHLARALTKKDRVSL